MAASRRGDVAFGSLMPQARSDTLILDVEGGVIAWSPIAAEPVSLEPLTAVLLQLLDGEVSADDLLVDLCEVLEVSEEVALDVLRGHLSLLDEAGLLTTSTPSINQEQELDIFPLPPNP